MAVADELRAIPTRIDLAPWPGHEWGQGWGVYVLPFSSGHALTLRVFPQNDFAPYVTIWHRDPRGNWSIYVDGPRIDTACPRYYGAAAGTIAMTSIRPRWTGPNTLHVTMDDPPLDWTLHATSSRLLAVFNAIAPRLPDAVQRNRFVLRVVESLARRVAGLGDITLSAVVPNGQSARLLPQRLYYIDRSTAVLDGLDLGHPVDERRNPRIGNLRMPTRPTLVAGRYYTTMLEPEEYAQTRRELGVA